MSDRSHFSQTMASLTSAFAPAVQSVPPVPGLPLVGNLLQFRKDKLALQDSAARIGPIARLQLAHIPLYVLTDADLAHEVLVQEASSYHKSAGLQFLRPLLGDGLLTAEGETHKRHRKLLAPAFAPKRLEKYGEIMVEETRKQMAGWTTGQRIDVSREMMEMTLAIAGRTMFGADVRSDAVVVGHALEHAMRAHEASIKSPFQVDFSWPLPRHLQMRKAVKMLDEIVYRLIADGRKRGTDKGDVLSLLLLARDEEDGSGLTDQQVRDEVMTLLLAGHETTANALTWAWYELGRHPDVLAHLVREVEPFGNRALTGDDLQKMPWNLAVIEEAMRLHPPAYMTGRETIEPVDLGGHHLPKGAIVLVNIRGIHRRADYFAAPEAFMPERMLSDAKKARPRHYYLPFGAGPRVCIGSHFALLEAQLCLATMVQRAKMQLLVTHVEPEPLVTLRPKGGLPALVELR